MAVPKPMLTKFGIHHILESCASVLRIILGDLSIAIHGEDVSANMDFVEKKLKPFPSDYISFQQFVCSWFYAGPGWT